MPIGGVEDNSAKLTAKFGPGGFGMEDYFRWAQKPAINGVKYPL